MVRAALFLILLFGIFFSLGRHYLQYFGTFYKWYSFICDLIQAQIGSPGGEGVKGAPPLPVGQDRAIAGREGVAGEVPCTLRFGVTPSERERK